MTLKESREINSRQNQEIKLVADLKLQKERHSQQKFVAEGLRTCQALLESQNISNFDVKIYCTSKMLESAQELVKYNLTCPKGQKTGLCKKNSKNPEIILVTDTVMEKISSASTPSGILCVLPMPKEPTADQLSCGIVLAGVSDPGNMGTLIRTCAAMGFKTIVLIDCTDVFSPKVIQSSAGEIGKVNIFNYTWDQLIKNKNKLKLVGLVISGGKNPEKIDFKDSLLVIGSEAHGIPEKWLRDCQELLTLPMPGKTESLNAAIAGSIAMYLASMQK